MSVEEADVSERLVLQVASDVGCFPMELPPLYEEIDPEALDTVVRRMNSGEISFEYADFQVHVRSDGSIELDEYEPRA